MDEVASLGLVTIAVNHKAADLVAVWEDLHTRTLVTEHDEPGWGGGATAALKLQ